MRTVPAAPAKTAGIELNPVASGRMLAALPNRKRSCCRNRGMCRGESVHPGTGLLSAGAGMLLYTRYGNGSQLPWTPRQGAIDGL